VVAAPSTGNCVEKLTVRGDEASKKMPKALTGFFRKLYPNDHMQVAEKRLIDPVMDV
jgi:hypothetical protein